MNNIADDIAKAYEDGFKDGKASVSEDAISRKDLQELFNEVTTSLMSKIDQRNVEHLVRACVMVTEMIQDAPSVVTDRPKGEWTKRDMDFTCSECGLMVTADFIDEHKGKPTMNFCPNCGADMRGDK